MALGTISLLIYYKVPLGFSPNGFTAIDYRCLDLLLLKVGKSRMSDAMAQMT